MRKYFMTISLIVIVALFLMTSQGLAQKKTGTIRGTVKDETNEPLPGVNVLIDGTSMGASTDEEGFFVILNIPPGTYTVAVQMIGYKTLYFQNIRVSTNSTITLNGKLEPSIIEGETIVVEVEKIATKKDQTGSCYF